MLSLTCFLDLWAHSGAQATSQPHHSSRFLNTQPRHSNLNEWFLRYVLNEQQVSPAGV